MGLPRKAARLITALSNTSISVSSPYPIIDLLFTHPLPLFDITISFVQHSWSEEDLATLEATLERSRRGIFHLQVLWELGSRHLIPVLSVFLKSDKVEAVTSPCLDLTVFEAKPILKLLKQSKNAAHCFCLRKQFSRRPHPQREMAVVLRGPYGADFVTDILREDPVLLSLETSGVEVGQLLERPKSELHRALKEAPKLRYLWLASAGITTKGVIVLLNALEEQKQLELLNLFRNPIGDEGCIAVAEFARRNSSLKALLLEEVKATSRGGIYLATLLKTNTSLQLLCMGRNRFDPTCGEAFANALKKNKSLHLLRLHRCKLRTEGVVGFIEAIRLNKTLRGLSLHQNETSAEVSRKLREAAQNTGFLRHLRVNMIGSHYRGQEDFAQSGNPQYATCHCASYAHHVFANDEPPQK